MRSLPLGQQSGTTVEQAAIALVTNLEAVLGRDPGSVGLATKAVTVVLEH